jgi:hypothetical protein
MSARVIEEDEQAILDKAEAEGRQRFGDDQLSVFDIAAIYQTANLFGVPDKMAYLRAKGLGLLSYQQAVPDSLPVPKDTHHGR